MRNCMFMVLAVMAAGFISAPALSETFKIYDLPAPDYPAACLDKGIEGTVVLALSISETGKLEKVTVASAPSACPAFAAAALSAIKKAKFYGAHGHRKILKQVIDIPVTFSINQS